MMDRWGLEGMKSFEQKRLQDKEVGSDVESVAQHSHGTQTRL
jgi:hypothetical protein